MPANTTRCSFAAVIAVGAFLSSCQCDRGHVLVALPPATTNTFTQAQGNALDVLLVVDNSLAMQPFQEQAAQHISDFVGFLNEANIDYQVAITSGDALGYNSPIAGGGRFSAQGGVAIVTGQTPNPIDVLQKNLALGNHGSNLQLPILSAMTALGLVKSQRGVPPAGNEGFVRAGARLAIIFITDGDDHSYQVSPDDRTSLPGNFLMALRDLKGAGNLGLVFIEGILFDGPVSTTLLHPDRLPVHTCGQPDAKLDQAVSTQLIDLIGNTPFQSFETSICGDSISSLRALAVNAAGFQTLFTLSQQADAAAAVSCEGASAPFCVKVAGQVVPSTSYRFDSAAQAIVFDQGYLPPAGSSVEIEFGTVDGTEVHTDDDGGFYTDCMTPADCPPGVECVDAQCHLTCGTDADCSAGFHCGSASTCVCQDSSACDAGLFCGASGACQPVVPCQLNTDCQTNQRCEAQTQRCVESGSCRLLSDAGYFGYFVGAYDCDRATACNGVRCVTGCTANEDCATGQSCASNAKCVAGCQRTEDCCLGDVCRSGACARQTVSASVALCDLQSCTGNLSACLSAGGACDARFDIQFGCVPQATSSDQCAKGYTLAQTPIIESPCTWGGNECLGGRSCSASLENTNGTCSCLSAADCAAQGTCSDPGGTGTKFCYGPPACLPRFQCIELFNSAGQLCSDSF